jgi:hypothetical protein
VCALGLVGAILAGVRHAAATPGLAIVFASVALRQAIVLQAGDLPAPGTLETAGEIAILCGAAGGLLALRSLRRTTHERDRVEDLHWDSMETVRAITEQAARPRAELSDQLRAVLELGAARFELPIGIAWREDGSQDGELLALRAPPAEAERSAVWLAELLPRLRDAARASRPAVLVGADDPHLVFAGPFAAGTGARGAIAFAGSRDREGRFTATDKDLIGLMAVWLAGELERRTPAGAPEAPAARPRPARLEPRRRPRRDRDLNGAVLGVERSLRRRLGSDATLELELGEDLPPVASGRLPLATLVESVVLAAARLAPTGRIRIETSRPAHAGHASAAHAGDVTLCASVTGAVDAAALERISAPAHHGGDHGPGALPLGTLERLLRRAGGDLSIAVEPGRHALLTAWLPAVDPALEAPRLPAPARARQPRAGASARSDPPGR